MTLDEAIQELKSDIEWSKLNTYPYISQRKVEALEMAIKALKQTMWIPVSERLPEESGNYLVVFRYGWIYCREVCYFDGVIWDKGGYDEVVKWQYLPD